MGAVMSASLGKRLQRELKASPKKAGALGLLCLVAIYFWLPLLTGNKDKTETAKAPTVKSAAVVTATPAAVTETDKTKEIFAAPSWRQLKDWIQRDPRRASARVAGGRRDPFVTPAPPPKEIVIAKETKPEPEADVTPQSAKLVLTSTLVGGKHRVAVINGKQYKVGQTIRGQANKADVQFTVTDISPRIVVVERQGRKYELKLHTVELANAEDGPVEETALDAGPE